MKIAKALKQKNKLVAELKQLRDRLEEYNAVIKGNPRPYDMATLQRDTYAKMQELVRLKTQIAQANNNVYDKIFELSELKGLVQFYKRLTIKDGIISDRYGEGTLQYEAVLKPNERDALVAELEVRIELLQDELDEFNTITEL